MGTILLYNALSQLYSCWNLSSRAHACPEGMCEQAESLVLVASTGLYKLIVTQLLGNSAGWLVVYFAKVLILKKNKNLVV